MGQHKRENANLKSITKILSSTQKQRNSSVNIVFKDPRVFQ